MFKKKKKVEPIQPPKQYDYTVWEKDLGFLTLLINRKLSISDNFFINPLNGQLQKKQYIRDEDIDPIVHKDVTEILEQTGSTYKNFLIEKYFGNEVNLVKFVTEEVYIRIIELSVKSNNIKIRANSQQEAIALVQKFNQGDAPTKKKSK